MNALGHWIRQICLGMKKHLSNQTKERTNMKPMKTLLPIFLGLGLSFSLHAQTLATIQTSAGDIQLRLNDEAAPKTVRNFIQYANKGFYNGTVFHRVIDGFMVQGGGFLPDMTAKATNKAIDNEANNGLKNKIGTIAMARTMQPNSATSQFFINVNNNDMLNYRNNTAQGAGYAVFGEVISGMDVVKKIQKSKTKSVGAYSDVPVTPIVIKKITIQN